MGCLEKVSCKVGLKKPHSYTPKNSGLKFGSGKRAFASEFGLTPPFSIARPSFLFPIVRLVAEFKIIFKKSSY